MIRVEGLSVSYGLFWLRDISLEVKRGESFVLLGPSGAGKTLLLETVLGLKRPERGKIFIGGRDMTSAAPEERGVAYVPQDLALFPHLSVRDNILFGPRVRGNDLAEANKEMLRLAELLDIAHLLARKDVRTLSGGEKQRVALARALITHPQVLFLDEPFSALDAYVRRHLQIQLRDLQRSLGLTLFQVTHDQEEAFLLADRLAIMMRGRIEQAGTPLAIHQHPANPQVARFLLMQNLFEGEIEAVEGKRVRVRIAGLRFDAVAQSEMDLRSKAIQIGIRPEEVLIVRKDRPLRDDMRLNLFEGEIERIINLGHRRLLRLRLFHCPDDDGLRLDCALSSRAARDTQAKEGDSIEVHIRPETIVLFGQQANLTKEPSRSLI